MNKLSKNDIWKVIDAFFREKGLVKHQLDSFDDFIDMHLVDVIVLRRIAPVPQLTLSAPPAHGNCVYLHDFRRHMRVNLSPRNTCHNLKAPNKHLSENRSLLVLLSTWIARTART